MAQRHENASKKLWIFSSFNVGYQDSVVYVDMYTFGTEFTAEKGDAMKKIKEEFIYFGQIGVGINKKLTQVRAYKEG